MPKSTPDPMAREVDRLLAGLATAGPKTDRDHRSQDQASTLPAGTKRHAPRARSTGTSTRGDRVALWARVLLGMGLSGAITQWPYPHGCGSPLLGYLGAVAMIVIAGAWIAIVSWRARGGVAHIMALIIFLWGLVLAAGQVLPRIGYAAEHASWRC